MAPTASTFSQPGCEICFQHKPWMAAYAWSTWMMQDAVGKEGTPLKASRNAGGVVESKEGQKVSKTPQLDKRIVNQNSSAVQCSK